MMRNTKSPIKQLEYASKLRMIDNHMAKAQIGPNLANSEYEHMLKMMALKLALEPPQEILPFVAKTVIFDTFLTRNFIIRQQIAPKSKNFMLNVSTYVHIKLEVKVNDRGPKLYNFQGNKAIQIYQPSFDEVNIVATVQKAGLFSTVKFYLDLMQVQYKSPKKIAVNLRPNIDKQLQDYLINNRGKSAEILRNRSLIRTKQNLMRRTSSEFKMIKNVELVRSKSQYQSFERKKSLYIKHVRKMSPSKDKILKQNEEKYHLTKKQQMANLAIIIYTAKLGMLLYNHRVKQSAQRLKQMKIIMLCTDFIKIIKNKFRLKMTQKARLRMSIHHTFQFLPTVIRSTAIQNAKNTLLEALTPYMNYRTIQQLGSNSEDYITSVIKIQKYSKQKSKVLRKRIRLFMQILMKQEKIVCSESNIVKIIQKYILTFKNKWKQNCNIYRYRLELIQLMREYSNV